MQVCPILSDRNDPNQHNIMDLVHHCPTSMLSEVTVNRVIDTGSFGLVLIVTTRQQKQFAIKLETVRYNPAVQERVAMTMRQKQRVVTLNEIIFQEVLALCRVTDLVRDGVADQFPMIYTYQVCPSDAIPAPYNQRLRQAQDIPHDRVEASTIVMSYINGDSVLTYHQTTRQPLPPTCQFDCLYGIFALVIGAHINLMLDLDVQNLLIESNPTDVYYELNYHDDTGDPMTLRLRFPVGVPRIKFIDFGAAIPLLPTNLATATVYTHRPALDPIHLVRFYRDQPDLFPMMSSYRAQLERPTRSLESVWDFCCNYLFEPSLTPYQVETIPPDAPLYQLVLS
jgi:hypothetical protein